MPSKILATGAGAAQGLEVLLARQLREDEFARRGMIDERDFAEKVRQSKVNEELAREQLAVTEGLRLATQASTDARAARDDKRADDAALMLNLTRTPQGSTFTDAQRARAEEAGAHPDLWDTNPANPAQKDWAVKAPTHEYLGVYSMQENDENQKLRVLFNDRAFQQRAAAQGLSVAEYYRRLNMGVPVQQVTGPDGLPAFATRRQVQDAAEAAFGGPQTPTTPPGGLTPPAVPTLDGVLAAPDFSRGRDQGAGQRQDPSVMDGMVEYTPGMSMVPESLRVPPATPPQAPPQAPPQVPQPRPQAQAQTPGGPQPQPGGPGGRTAPQLDDQDRPQPMRPPPPASLVVTATMEENAEKQLLSLRALYDDQVDAQGNVVKRGAKHLVGPLEGRARSWGQVLPLPDAWEPPDEELRQFADLEAAEAALLTAVVKAATGANMTEGETRRIGKFVPNASDKPAVWESKYQITMENIKMLRATLAARGLGLDLKPLPTAPGAPGAGMGQGRITTEIEPPGTAPAPEPDLIDQMYQRRYGR